MFGNLFVKLLDKMTPIEEKIYLIPRNVNLLRLKYLLYKIVNGPYSQNFLGFSRTLHMTFWAILVHISHHLWFYSLYFTWNCKRLGADLGNFQPIFINQRNYYYITILLQWQLKQKKVLTVRSCYSGIRLNLFSQMYV